MGANRTTQAHVVLGATADPSQGFWEMALFNADGSPFTGTTIGAATTATAGIVKKAVANADVSAANGSDAATTQTLANALKVTLNGLQAALRTAGVLS